MLAHMCTFVAFLTFSVGIIYVCVVCMYYVCVGCVGVSRFVTGVIARERMPTFERVLWRACRGNVFLRQTEIEEPLENPTTVRNIPV